LWRSLSARTARGSLDRAVRARSYTVLDMRAEAA
jgi:hypothetical protein